MGKVSRRIRTTPPEPVAPPLPRPPPPRQRLAPPPLPPVAEGHYPTALELEAKMRNGRYYLDDVWRIEREFPTRDNYSCRTDLLGLVSKLSTSVTELGYEMVDSSHRLENITHALHLAEAWAILCREARTTQTLHIVRRTPQNSGAALMVQRQEHLRGQCSEMTPLAYIAICRDDQHVVTRDQVADQAVTERLILSLAGNKDDCCIDSAIAPRASVPIRFCKEAVGGCGRSKNMPAALFRQQMNHLRVMMETMGVAPAFAPPPPPPPVVDVCLFLEDGLVKARMEVV